MNFSWKQTATLEVDFPSGDAMRLILGTCTSRGQGRFQQALRERTRYLEERFGKDHNELWGKDAEAETEFLRTYERAVWFACLQSVEIKNSTGDFVAGDLPAEWKDITTYTENVPPEISAKASEISIEINPGAFLAAQDEAEKNAGRLNVKRLMH